MSREMTKGGPQKTASSLEHERAGNTRAAHTCPPLLGMTERMNASDVQKLKILMASIATMNQV